MLEFELQEKEIYPRKLYQCWQRKGTEWQWRAGNTKQMEDLNYIEDRNQLTMVHLITKAQTVPLPREVFWQQP